MTACMQAYPTGWPIADELYRCSTCECPQDCLADAETCTSGCSYTTQSTCDDGSCLFFWDFCDGAVDCADGSDEVGCP